MDFYAWLRKNSRYGTYPCVIMRKERNVFKLRVRGHDLINISKQVIRRHGKRGFTNTRIQMVCTK